MKKWMLRGFAVVLAVGLCTASVYAAGGHHGFRLTRDGCSVQPRAAQSCRYSDADGDGLCDLCDLPAGAGHSCRGDADGDGLCDLCGLPAGAGHSCRGDADGDGLCDLCGLPAGAGHSCRGDADGDGLCDLCGLPAGAGHSCRGDGICQVCGQAAGSCICAGTQHAQTPAAGSGGGHHGHHAGRGC